MREFVLTLHLRIHDSITALRRSHAIGDDDLATAQAGEIEDLVEIAARHLSGPPLHDLTVSLWVYNPAGSRSAYELGLRGEGRSAVGHGTEHPFVLNYELDS